MSLDLSKAKYLAPNALTLGSIFAGFNSINLAVHATSSRDMVLAALLIIVAMICDGLDGRVARLTKTESEFGVQMDSLADAISFGVAPAFLMFEWGLRPLGVLGLFLAFVYAACAVLRLARFNVLAADSEGVRKYFTGLPAPLAAGAVVSVVLAHISVSGHQTTLATYSVGAMAVLLGFVMVSNIRYRTFKDVNFRGRAGVLLAGGLGLSVGVGVVFRPSVAFVLMMMLYILLGVFGGIVQLSRTLLGETEANELDFEAPELLPEFSDDD